VFDINSHFISSASHEDEGDLRFLKSKAQENSGALLGASICGENIPIRLNARFI
jgi:hypothetical protein